MCGFDSCYPWIFIKSLTQVNLTNFKLNSVVLYKFFMQNKFGKKSPGYLPPLSAKVGGSPTQFFPTKVLNRGLKGVRAGFSSLKFSDKRFPRLNSTATPFLLTGLRKPLNTFYRVGVRKSGRVVRKSFFYQNLRKVLILGRISSRVTFR